jgi:hypothetical protein
MGPVDMQFPLHWLWIAMPLAALLAPLLILKTAPRGTYAIVLTFLGMSACIGLWVFDARAGDSWSFAHYHDLSPTSSSCQEIEMKSAFGEVGLRMQWFVRTDQQIEGIAKNQWLFHWSRMPVRGISLPFGSVTRHKSILYLQGGGFEVLVKRDMAGIPGLLSFPWVSSVVVPDWFLLVLLSIYPAWRMARHKHSEKYRRRHNLCINCGYSLQGQLAPVRCPECGTARNLVDTKLGDAPVIDCLKWLLRTNKRSIVTLAWIARQNFKFARAWSCRAYEPSCGSPGHPRPKQLHADRTREIPPA